MLKMLHAPLGSCVGALWAKIFGNVRATDKLEKGKALLDPAVAAQCPHAALIPMLAVTIDAVYDSIDPACLDFATTLYSVVLSEASDDDNAHLVISL